MIIRPQLRRPEQGSVLMISLVIASLFGMFLVSYLCVARNQRNMVTRSQAWNGALAMAEAGVEEALAQLNPGAPEPVIDRTANGWGAPSAGLYGPVSRSLPLGSYSVVYTTDPFPTIYATGYVAVPSIPATLARVVRVTTATTPMFKAAMSAKFGIDLKGNNVATDSFNSADPNLSLNGQYSPTKASTNGDIGSITGILNVGNANVSGKVLLGPTATDSIGQNGFVLGGVHDDFNVEFEDVVLPRTTWVPALALPVTILGVTYQYYFGNSGDYSITGLSGNIYVAPNAHVRLKLIGDASPTVIEVAGTGSSAGNLAIYMTGQTFTLSSNATVDGGNAANLAYYGLPGNTSLSFTGNASFTGTIYAPEADFKLGGGGGNTYDFVGASVTASVTMNGHFNFHYDENLGKAGPVLGFVAHSWSEL
jgi:hypothetical protein